MITIFATSKKYRNLKRHRHRNLAILNFYSTLSHPSANNPNANHDDVMMTSTSKDSLTITSLLPQRITSVTEKILSVMVQSVCHVRNVVMDMLIVLMALMNITVTVILQILLRYTYRFIF